jgi:hypothetical protein
MDIYSHFLWTNLTGRATKRTHKVCLWMAVFGFLPDIVAFGYNFSTQIAGHINLAAIGGSYHLNLASVPPITFTLSNYSHSFIIFAAVFAVVSIVLNKLYIPLLGWGMHILIDIPTHTIGHFAPPYLFPFHTPLINGIGWSNPYFMLFDFTILFYIYHELHLKKHTTRLMRKIFKPLGKPDKLGE